VICGSASAASRLEKNTAKIASGISQWGIIIPVFRDADPSFLFFFSGMPGYGMIDKRHYADSKSRISLRFLDSHWRSKVRHWLE